MWERLVEQRDKLSERASWLAFNEDAPEWEERRQATTRSREKFEGQLRGLAKWAGVGVGDVAGLLAEAEA